jgi:dTDP-4-dehydrorhamnose reductase
MQKILLIGKSGQVGWELQRTCCTLGEVVALDYPEIDLANVSDIRSLISEVKPSILINAAAYTNVEKAESEPEVARAVNAIAPGVMAEEAKKLGSVFIHYSTDYVFDGTKGNPYVETDTPNPLNVYGASKLEGEQLVQAAGGDYLIFRTSWVYSMRHGGFVTKVLQWARSQETLRIVDDQIGSPTWARMLAESTSQVIAQGRGEVQDYIREKAGLYHLAGGGSCSRYEWARAILELDPKKEEQIVKQFIPISTESLNPQVNRPSISTLDFDKIVLTFSLVPVNWKVLLSMTMMERK